RSALIGVVYKHFVPCDNARDTANSPTIVLPAPVGAQTRTPWPSATASQPAIWKSSSGCDNFDRNSSKCGRFISAHTTCYQRLVRMDQRDFPSERVDI